MLPINIIFDIYRAHGRYFDEFQILIQGGIFYSKDFIIYLGSAI